MPEVVAEDSDACALSDSCVPPACSTASFTSVTSTGMNDSPSVFVSGSGCWFSVPTRFSSVTVSPVSMFLTSPSLVTARFSETTVAVSGISSLTVSGSLASGLFGMLSWLPSVVCSSTVVTEVFHAEESSTAISCNAYAGTPTHAMAQAAKVAASFFSNPMIEILLQRRCPHQFKQENMLHGKHYGQSTPLPRKLDPQDGGHGRHWRNVKRRWRR